MRSLCLLTCLLALPACRTGRLTPLPVSLADHVSAALRPAPAPGDPDPALAALEAKTQAIAAEWNERLGQPAQLSPVLDLSSPQDVQLRAAATSSEFASGLAAGLTERQLVVSTFERSPQVRAALEKLRGTVNQYAQVTALDTILAQYASFQRSSMTKVGMPLAGDRIDQAFPFPGSLELKAALVKHTVEEARARYAAAVRDVVVEARVLFARYVFVGRALAVSEATFQYLTQLEDTARSRFEAGTGSKSAVIQVQVERSDLRNTLVTLAQDRVTIRADLVRLLDIAPDTDIGPPDASAPEELPKDVERLRRDALIFQPDVQAAEARVRRMQTMIELAEQTAYPPLSAGLSTMEPTSHATGGSDKEREPFTTDPKVVPDPWFGSKEAYLREAREGARAAESRAQAVRNRTAFAVQSTYAALETAHRLHRLYREVQIAQAEQAYRDAASGYAADRVEFLNVVDAIRRWLRFQLEDDRAVRDIHASRARLEGAVGRPLGSG